MLYFHSPNEFPLDVLSIVGLSAKVTNTPIGEFGTGLKYAIAVILRLEGSITLRSEGRAYTFGTSKRNLRDTNYEAITMTCEGVETLLPFTLNYGKDWKDWMAYRELFSNCLDESGGVSRTPIEARTVFEVTGLDQCYENHDRLFLAKDLPMIFESAKFQLIDQKSSTVYYRNIKVAEVMNAHTFTMNILTKQMLTEDRTLRDIYSASGMLEQAMLTEMTSAQIKRVFNSPYLLKDFPYLFAYSNSPPSEAFIEACKTSPNAPLAAVDYVRKHDPNSNVREEIVLSSFQQRELDMAVAFASKIIREIQLEDIKICSSLKGALGLYNPRTEEIWISQDAFEEGFDSLCATIIEEAAHKYLRFEDNSRAFQEYLLKKMVYFAKQVL